MKKIHPLIKVFLFMALAMVLCIGGCEWKMSSDLASAKANARKAGLALTFNEFRKLLPSPIESENAATVINKLIAIHPKNTPNDISALKLVCKPNLSKSEVEMMQSSCPQLDQICRTAEELEGKTAVDFHRKWESGASLLFPEYSTIKSTSQLLSLAARLRAYGGDRLGALKLLKFSFQLGELAGTEPTLISMLVMSACESIAFSTLSLVIGTQKLSDEELQVIRDIRKLLGDLKPLNFYLQSDLPGVLDVFEKDQPFDPRVLTQFESELAMEMSVMSTPLKKVVLADIITLNTRAIEIASDQTLTPSQLLDSAKALDKSNQPKSKNDIVRRATITFVPMLGGTAQARTRQIALRRLLDILIGNAISLDPFNDLAFKTRKQGLGTIFYSVGPNLKDDTGIIYDTNGMRIKGVDDIAIFVPR